MSSFFTGLGELFNAPHTQTQDSKFRQFKCFPGFVLDVILDESHPMYKVPEDIGSILFRDLVREWGTPEKDVKKIAQPVDRSFARYPYPGEQVIIFRAYGMVTDGINGLRGLGNIYFYSFVVGSHGNVSWNTEPFLGGGPAAIDPTNLFPDEEELRKRFEKKIKKLDAIKSGENVKVHKQLRPNEGDFILQGRFGQSIRFGSTADKEDSGGLAGDGLLKIRVDRDYTTKSSDMFVDDDINKDDACIYLCTSQKVPVELSCTKQMKSWRARYKIGPVKGTNDDVGLFDYTKEGVPVKVVDVPATNMTGTVAAAMTGNVAATAAAPVTTTPTNNTNTNTTPTTPK
jgi:hypothetical protein